VTKVSIVAKVTKPIKVSEENCKRLFSLAGELQKARGKNQTPDDAITYLFENQKGRKIK